MDITASMGRPPVSAVPMELKTTEFTLITKKQTQWLPNDGYNIKTFFSYPIIILLKKQNITLYNLQRDNIENEDAIEMDSAILDAKLQDSILWIILATNKIMAVNINSRSIIEVKTSTSDFCKLTKIQCKNNNVILQSESGEYFYTDVTETQIIEQMKGGNNILEIATKKIQVDHMFNDQEKCMYNGLAFYIEKNNLVAECPITGLCETLSTATVLMLEQVMVWEDYLVLAGTQKIVIVDIDELSIIYELEPNCVCCPISSHLNSFYFLSFKEDKVVIKTLVRGRNQLSGNATGDISIAEQLSQDVLKSQLKSLVEANFCHPDTEVNQELIKKLLSLYQQIDDISFLIEVGHGISKNLNILKEIVHELKKKVTTLEDKKDVFEIYDLSFKCDLIELINFKGLGLYDSMDIFQRSFVDLCAMFLENMDIDLASLCWLKYSEVIEPLASQSVLKILNSIKPNTKIGLLVMWLKNFVPKLLDQNPYHVDVFTRWASERVFLLESSSHWPKIGYRFIEEIKKVLVAFLKTVIIMPLSLDDLDVLKDHVQYIMELKEKYRINMLINELSSLSPIEVILIMLHRCYTEDLESFTNNFLPIFSTRYGLEIDEILQSYINNEATSGSGSIDAVRFTTLLRSFRKPSNKLDCLLNVLRVLNVPWDDKICEVALKSAALSLNDYTLNESERHLAKEIAEEINYAKLKVVLKKYNFSTTCVDYVLVLHKIVNSSTVSVQDLQTVMSAMTTFKQYGSTIYIDRCLRDSDTNEALTYYRSLKKYEIKVISKSLITKYEYYAKHNSKSIQRCYIDFFKGSGALEKNQFQAIEQMYYFKNQEGTSLTLNEIFAENPKDNNSDVEKVHPVLKTNVLNKISTCCLARDFVCNLLKAVDAYSFRYSKEFFSLLLIFEDGKNLPLLIESQKIITQLALEVPEEYVGYLCNILYILNCFILNISTLRNLSVAWKFNYIFLPITSISAVNDQIIFYNYSINENIQHEDEYLRKIGVKNDLTPLRVLSNLCAQDLDNFTHCPKFAEFQDDYLNKIIERMISSQEIDELFLTSLLLVVNKPVTEKTSWLIDLLKCQNDILSTKAILYLTSVTTKSTLSFGEEVSRSIVSYPPQYVLKTKLNLNLAEIALPDITEQTWDAKMVLYMILNNDPAIKVDRLIEICRILSVSLNDGLSLQLIAILTSWELIYKIIADDYGYRHLFIENDAQTLIKKCLSIWESIKDKNWVKDILSDFWENREVSLHGRLVFINPYYYEVYLCIYHLSYEKFVDMKNSKIYYLLNFLKDYKRCSNPQQYELELFSEKGMFPEIGYYRIPFNLFMREDMWLNLKSEITLETYESWLSCVALLSLDPDLQIARDMICSNALKQTMKSRSDLADIDKNTEPWQLTPREEPLLRAAQRCVRHISNMEWAGACLFYVLQGCARGADQVAAAHFCYQFAKRWNALQPGNRAVRKMERYYSSLSTRHALHKLEWATEDLIQLTVEPAQLIRKIYLHPNLFEKTSRFDVNEATNEIADKNGINISSIRIQILENILEKKNNENNKSIGLERNELLVAKYILKATCPKMGAIYLSRIATDDKSDSNKCKKLRALQCLMSIVDQDTAIKVTNTEREQLWYKVLEMFYVVNLEKLDLPWIIETFTENKSRALSHICPSTLSNLEGLKLVADIARRYGETDYVLKLIPALLRFGLQEELILLLLKVQLMVCSENIYLAWRAILLRPFESADYPITEKQKTNCMRAVNLLPLCPAVKDKDLIEIWKHCVRCKCFGIACLLLPYMSQETRNSLTEIRKIDKRNLVASLKNLQMETYLVPGAMLVLETMISKSCKR